MVGRIESSKESEPAPSTSGLNEISAYLPSAIAEVFQLYHLLSLFQSVTLLTCSSCQPLYVSSCRILLCYTRYFPVRLKCVLYFCVCFMYYLCEKYYISIIVQYCIVDCVGWVPRLTLLDLWMNWTYKHALERNSFACRELIHKTRTAVMESTGLHFIEDCDCLQWPTGISMSPTHIA